MYILFSGEVGVYMDNKCIAVLKEGKVFGERALETDEVRSATVKVHE